MGTLARNELILSEFKKINYPLFLSEIIRKPEFINFSSCSKSSGNLMFSDDFRGNRS